MHRGYVKLWRKSLDAGWLKNSKLWWFWCWCLMKASYKEIDVIVGYQKVHLMPGDFVFGLHAASKETYLSVQEIRTALAFLGKHENLTMKATNKFSVISIVNWEVYQGDESVMQQASQQTTNKQLTTNKNDKNEKNKRKTFIIPSLEEVRAYCTERKNIINPQTFIDHYTGNGWKVGPNPMKDWKAVVRTWESRGGNGDGSRISGRGPGVPTTHTEWKPEAPLSDEQIRKNQERVRSLIEGTN